MHDKGNEENILIAWTTNSIRSTSVHLNPNYSRSWFQTPNSYDSQYASAWYGDIVNAKGIGPNGQVWDQRINGLRSGQST